MSKLILALLLMALPFTAYAECDSNEVGYVATFQVKPGSEKEFEAAIVKLAETVQRVEEGAILYAPYRGTDGKYFMMERYTDEAARKAHGTATEVQALFPTIGPYLAGPADIQPVSAICSK
jgi:quinol monooxygenase YgiN